MCIRDSPFAPPGRPQRVHGREDLRRYLEPLLARVAYDEISDLIVYCLLYTSIVPSPRAPSVRTSVGDQRSSASSHWLASVAEDNSAES